MGDDITEATQTIIGLMKNSTTGVGTVGYEITDDNSSGLTIADGEILVTATLSKDELRDQFGGTQDYDVIIVVRVEKIDDEWIGLSTKQYTEYVLIEVNVIDKWSAVATKYITGDLVRAKATNAIRKFIKAKTNNPGGTIGIWKLVGYDYEEDTNTKPTLWKAIMRTEAWMYYNPNEVTCATGEQVSNGGLETGDFSGWVNDRWSIVTSTPSPQAGIASAKGTILNSILSQKFNILVACFTVGSIAQVGIFAEDHPCTADTDEVTITLIFDNGYTEDIVVNSTGGWDTQSFLQNILDAVTNNNIETTDRLIEVRFTVTGLDYNGYVGVDGLSIIAEG